MKCSSKKISFNHLLQQAQNQELYAFNWERLIFKRCLYHYWKKMFMHQLIFNLNFPEDLSLQKMSLAANTQKIDIFHLFIQVAYTLYLDSFYPPVRDNESFLLSSKGILENRQPSKKHLQVQNPQSLKIMQKSILNSIP